jgi:hypothetical protein
MAAAAAEGAAATSLCVAAGKGDDAAVLALLAAGAAVDGVDHAADQAYGGVGGKTPLWIAVLKGHAAVAGVTLVHVSAQSALFLPLTDWHQSACPT